MLFNADIRQNFTLEEGNLKKQEYAKHEVLKSRKRERKVYARPGLS